MKKLVSVYDVKADNYGSPITITAEAVFVRDLGDMFRKDPDNSWCEHPDDFTVYHVGGFDPVTGNVTVCQPQKLFDMSFVVSLIGSVPSA